MQKVAEQVEKENRRMEVRLSMLTATRLGTELADNCRLSTTNPENLDKTVRGFELLIATAKLSLTRSLEACRINLSNVSETAWFWRDVKVTNDASTVRKILDEAFGNFESRLRGYFFNKYWKTGEGSNYWADQEQLRRCIEKAESTLVQSARIWWLYSAKRHLVACQNKFKEMQREHESWLEQEKEAKFSIVTFKNKLKEHVEVRQKFEQDMAKDLKESQRFISLLDSEYLEELRQRRAAVLSEKRAEVAFVYLLATIRLTHVRQELLLRMEPSGA